MDDKKNNAEIRYTWYWIKAPRTIPELGICKGDLLLVNIETGQILGAERFY